ncbi:hypothetical protein LIER_35455 [Lithospermum erythrorhizon]|uniref:Retrotransposon gag domain-containing protein n=1 Tax=Lithospermum erythrorhizon TaxID=34254 RepID=A0AAV3NS19_LITER
MKSKVKQTIQHLNNSAPEQTTQAHVELPIEAPPYFIGNSQQRFSFDKILPSEWRDKVYEMHAWSTEQLLPQGTSLPTVIDKFVAKIHGTLRQWWITFGSYGQLQIRQTPTVDSLIAHIHNEFLGSWEHYTTQSREEYLATRCYFFKRKDLEKYYERMSKRFYALGGIDDVNLKQAYLKSLPEPLGNETARILSMKNIALHTTTFGELYQTSLAALEKLCNH